MRVVVSYPNEPDDAQIEIMGLGVFPNHSETEVDDETVDAFVNVFRGYVPEGAEALVFGADAEPMPEDFYPERPTGADQRQFGADYFEGTSAPGPLDEMYPEPAGGLSPEAQAVWDAKKEEAPVEGEEEPVDLSVLHVDNSAGGEE